MYVGIYLWMHTDSCIYMRLSMCTCKYKDASTHRALHTNAYTQGCSYLYMHLHIDMRRCGPEALPRVPRKRDVFPDELRRRPAVCTKSVSIQPQRFVRMAVRGGWMRDPHAHTAAETRAHAHAHMPAPWAPRPVRGGRKEPLAVTRTGVDRRARQTEARPGCATGGARSADSFALLRCRLIALVRLPRRTHAARQPAAPPREARRRRVGVACAPATAMCSAYTSWTVLNTFPATTDAR
jgi:hypothetical protein